MSDHRYRPLLLSLFLICQAGFVPMVMADTAQDASDAVSALKAILHTLPDGRIITLSCSGSGAPTVIITPGAAGPLDKWVKITSHLEKSTRVCTWYRAGFGFSDSSSKVPVVANSTSDLESALKSAKVEGPYVMVGHSIGGLESLLFADHNRNAVVGMVLIDTAVPDQVARIRKVAPQIAAIDAAFRRKMIDRLRRCASLVGNGAIQPGSQTPAPCPKVQVNKSHWAAEFLASDAAGWSAEAALMENFDASAASLTNPSRRFGDMPLIVLTAGKRGELPDAAIDTPALAEKLRREYRLFGAELNRAHAELDRAHAELAALSTRGILRRAADSSHYIQFDRPDLVIEAINEVLVQTREGPKAATPDGEAVSGR